MSGLYLRGRQAFGEGLDWTHAEARISLVDAAYQFDEKHDMVSRVKTIGEPRELFDCAIPNGEACCAEAPVVFDTPHEREVGAVLVHVGSIPIALLDLDKNLKTNGGEIEVILPRPLFSL